MNLPGNAPSWRSPTMPFRARVRPSRTTRIRPMLEVLEDRSLLSGDLLLTSQVPGSIGSNLLEYTQDGTLVSSRPIPAVPGSTEGPEGRGLSVDPSGNVNIFDGTFTPARTGHP